MSVTVATQTELNAAIAAGETFIELTGDGCYVVYGSATVTASDSATVTAYDSATVTASKYVSVHTTGSGITVVGGVVIAVPDVDEMTSGKEWCEYAGISANGKGTRILYKAVDENLISGHGTAYHIGSTVTAEDFEDARRCGNGLHFSQSPHHANAYRSHSTNSRFLAVKVRTRDLVILGNDKVKAPSCEVLYEVDINGNRLESSND